jgi:hypothetical protein
MAEKTKPQVLFGVPSFEQHQQLARRSLKYAKAREMRKDATVALARWFVSAPLIASGWSIEEYEDAPEGMSDFIWTAIEPLRLELLQSAAYGLFDYGWQSYEKVFGLTANNEIIIKKLKPLLVDHTDILIDKDTGAFIGLKQGDIKLSVDESLLLYFEVEGTDWYGTPIAASVEAPYDNWNVIEEAAKRYDNKVAGTHVVVKYPLGSSLLSGVETDNKVIAQRIIDAFSASGTVAVPAREEAGEGESWSIELLTDNSAGRSGFVERQAYLDKLKVRGAGLPERAVLEGEYGTKADAEAHADFAILNIQLRHQMITHLLNKHLVNHLIRLNYGSAHENQAYIKPNPISDQSLKFLREIYKAILANPDGFLEESLSLDRDALRDSVSLPTAAEEPETNLDHLQLPKV